MGNKPMKCSICGNVDINKILVTMDVEGRDGQVYRDTTTLPKFLYYLEHPTDLRGKGGSQKRPWKIKRVIGYSCENCPTGDIKSEVPFNRIKSTRYGV